MVFRQFWNTLEVLIRLGSVSMEARISTGRWVRRGALAGGGLQGEYWMGEFAMMDHDMIMIMNDE